METLEQQFKNIIIDKFSDINLSEERINNIAKYCVHHSKLENIDYHTTLYVEKETTIPLAIKILAQINTDTFEILQNARNVETRQFKISYNLSEHLLGSLSEGYFHHEIIEQIVNLINEELKNNKKLFIWNLISEIKASFDNQTFKPELLVFSRFILE